MSNQPPRESKSKLNYDESSRQLQRAQPDGPLEVIKRHNAFLTARMTQIAKWCTQGIKPEALVRFALMDMDGVKGEPLRKCDPQSIYLGLLACAVTGLEPGALKGEAYLVPYGGVATFMPGWRGLVKQVRRSREVTAISSQIVCERDHFELDLGTEYSLKHRPALKDRGDMIGAYAIAHMTNGTKEIEWMDMDDLDKVRKASKSPAWRDWADQMYRKAPIRRLCKRLPLGGDYFVALALEQAGESGESQSKVLDRFTDSAAEQAQTQGAAAAEMAAQAGEPDEDELREIAERERREANV